MAKRREDAPAPAAPAPGAGGAGVRTGLSAAVKAALEELGPDHSSGREVKEWLAENRKEVDTEVQSFSSVLSNQRKALGYASSRGSGKVKTDLSEPTLVELSEVWNLCGGEVGDLENAIETVNGAVEKCNGSLAKLKKVIEALKKFSKPVAK